MWCSLLTINLPTMNYVRFMVKGATFCTVFNIGMKMSQRCGGFTVLLKLILKQEGISSLLTHLH